MSYSDPRFTTNVYRNDQLTNTGKAKLSTKRYNIDITNRSDHNILFSVEIGEFGLDGITIGKSSYDLPRCSPSETVRHVLVAYSKEKKYAITSIVLDNQEHISLSIDLGVGDISSQKGSFCFVATAVFGDPDEEHVVLLRRFRDRKLVKSLIGRAFVRFYEIVGPALGDLVVHRPILRRVVRRLLVKIAETIERRGEG